MRNLKRVLSLALSAIMVLGMMVIGAGAANLGDFSDSEKITNKEAVSVLTTLGVINGKDNGTYDPEGTVTRGEMAKMICVILNGGKDPQLGATVKNTYTDTASHWAAPYIEYCTTKGIVAGRGDGRFDPDGTVSVSEAAKMLLVALGYNASVQGYVGGSWQINTDVTANQKGLYDGLETLNTSTALTRDNAAQMCYNALDIRMVQYNYVITGNAQNAITTQPQLDETSKKTLLVEMFNAVKVEGVVIANEFANLESGKKDSDLAPGVIGAALDSGKTKLSITNNDDQEYYKGELTFNVASGKDEMARNVALYVKIENNVSKAQVIGSAIVTEDNQVVTDCTSDTVKDVADDNDLDISSTAKVATNYASLAALGDGKADATAGVEKTLIDYDGDGDLDYVLLNNTEFGKVTKYSSTDKGSITVSLAKGSFVSEKSANVVGFEDVAKDDYVLASYVGGRLYVSKPETVTGTIEAYKNNSKGTLTTKLTVEGTEYNVAATGAVTVPADDVHPAKDLFTQKDKAALDTDATFYLDGNGYIVARGQVVEAAYNYAYVKDADNGSYTVDSRVKVVLPDGTTKTCTIDSKSAVKLQAVNSAIASGVNPVYAYSLTSNGSNIKLTNPVVTVSGGSATFEKGKSTITIARATGSNITQVKDNKTTDLGASNKQYATNSTVFFYVDKNNDVSVYTGRNNAPSITSSTNTYVYRNNADTVVAVVFTGTVTKASVGNHMLVYSLGSVSSDYTYANVILNGKDETETVKIDANSSSILEADKLYTYTLNGDGYYELEKAENNANNFYATGKVIHAYNTSIVLEDGKEFLVNDKTVVVDNHDATKTPTASLNGNINQGDTVKVLIDDDKAVMVEITKLASTGNESNNGGGSIDVSGITGTKMSENSPVEDVNKNLDKGNVIITGDYAPTDTVSSTSEDSTLVVNGNFAPKKPVAMVGDVIVHNDKNTATYTVPKTTDGTTSISNDVQADNMHLNGDTKLGGNATVTGNITAESDADLAIASGAKVNVDGNVKATEVTIAGDTEIKGAVEATTITIAKDTTVTVGEVKGNPTVNGTLYVKDSITGEVKVYSANSLYVDGDVKGDLTVGGDDGTGKAEVKGTVSGTVTVAADSSLTVGSLKVTKTDSTSSLKLAATSTLIVNGKLSGGANIDATAGAKITFGGSGEVTDKFSITESAVNHLVFLDKNGTAASEFGGKTFTCEVKNEKVTFVSDVEGEPEATAELFFVYDEATWDEAVEKGVPADWMGDDNKYHENVENEPWIVVKVSINSAFVTDKDMKLDLSTLKFAGANNGTIDRNLVADETQTQANESSPTYTASLKFDAATGKTYFIRSLDLRTPDDKWSDKDNTKDYLKQTEVASGSTYTVTLDVPTGEDTKVAVEATGTYNGNAVKYEENQNSGGDGSSETPTA